MAHQGARLLLVSCYLRGLETRLEYLEKNASLSHDTTSTAVPTYSARTPDPTTPILHHGTARQESPALTRRASMSELSPCEVMPRSVVIDANVSIGGVSLAQMIIAALRCDDQVRAEAMTTDHDIRGGRYILPDEDMDLYTLPKHIWDILERFFTSRHILTPVFHVPSIRSIFAAAIRCPRGQRHQHQSSFILLNMVLALCTSHWIVDMEANSHNARKYYDIAMTLLQPSIFRDWKLEHVQALLIGARYLQGSNCANECWNILGLAIRIAQGLRLHQDPPKTDPVPLREIKRRTWYAAYTLDIHFSMIYERPSTIKSTDFSTLVPEDLDDDCISENGLLYPFPRRPSSSMSFFLQVIKLSRIVENVLLRASGDAVRDSNIVELITVFDDAYQKWRREIPPHLILDIKNASLDSIGAVSEPSWILSLRGNMVRILIHRHSLVWTLRRLAKHQHEEDSMSIGAQQRTTHDPDRYLGNFPAATQTVHPENELATGSEVNLGNQASFGYRQGFPSLDTHVEEFNKEGFPEPMWPFTSQYSFGTLF
ncbi:uncharacterized protein TRUGW13939_02048 [Talaromyces rugulosus]|uniref:Xylanolytic transcriptional activator regulatory domain-containing protein n=1 Tax=Talaromyces rugulosus TaxID=121627 RepID=A0A7H8QM77_TALRU|nr:uncharacterized protein TRUGW13939_02048 [Talaromyces rugulosus]QKX54958.1 hypothetical protein TRUGW13939_02048 [Talaromyces rugulosus]